MLRLDTLSKYYVTGTQVITGIKSISASFVLGEFVIITGASGSGKTTLLNVIAGSDNYNDGVMIVEDENTEYFGDEDWERYRKEIIGLVYQDYNLLENTSVFRNVEIAYQLNSDTDKRQRYIEVNNILETTGLLKFATQRVSTLSGGQKQRVAIARALAKDTPIILADEPTGNLDSIAAHEIIELLHSISKDKLIIVVTHSAEQFIGKASREIILHNGEIISDKQLDSISQQTIKPHETLKTKREMINNRRKIGRLIENDIFSDIKNSISFTFITALIMLMVLLIGSIFAQFSTRSYEGVINTPVFGTIDRERLILKKENKTAFTSNELSMLKNDSSFVQVVKNDILLDLMFECEFEHDYGKTEQQFYANTIDAAKVVQGTLTWGRLPVANDEVIISSDTGEVLNENLREVLLVSVDMPEKSRFVKIVGGIRDNSKYIQTVYFTETTGEEIADYFIDKYSTLTLTSPNDKSIKDRFTILLSDEANDDTIYVTQKTANELGISKSDALVIGVDLKTSYYEKTAEWSNIEIISPTEETIFDFKVDKNSSTIIVSKNAYQRLLSDDTYQVSVYMKNPSSYKAIIEKVENAGYVAYYPYVINESENPAEQILTLFWIFLICILIGIGLVFLSLLLLRKMSKNNVRRIAILQSLGYDNKHVLYASIFANIIKTVLGSMISVAVVGIVSFHAKSQIGKEIATFIPYANIPIWFAILASLIIATVYVVYFAHKYRKIDKRTSINQMLKIGGAEL